MGQIEGVMSRADGVAMAAVVAAGQSRRGVGLVAYAALTRPGMTDADTILDLCRAELPARAVPDRLIIAESLPVLASGKVDRRALTTQAQTETAAHPLD
jgi:acyl-coenzyme A synthetase/AMP-(fatty) acid ligase